MPIPFLTGSLRVQRKRSKKSKRSLEFIHDSRRGVILDFVLCNKRREKRFHRDYPSAVLN